MNKELDTITLTALNVFLKDKKKGYKFNIYGSTGYWKLLDNCIIENNISKQQLKIIKNE